MAFDTNSYWGYVQPFENPNPYNAELFLYKPEKLKGFFNLKSS